MLDASFGFLLIVAGLLMAVRPRWSIPALLSPPEDETGVPWPVRRSTKIRIGGVAAVILGVILVLAGGL